MWSDPWVGGSLKLKSATNDDDDPRKSPKPNSTMPDSYLNSDLTCGLAATAISGSRVRFFLTGDRRYPGDEGVAKPYN